MTEQKLSKHMPETAADCAEEVLRRRAEEKARQNSEQVAENTGQLSAEAVRTVLHELQVHQIELEMQNEELRRSQQELELSRAQYFELYNLAPVGYLTISEKGLILEANRTFGTLTGMSTRALEKQSFSRLIFREDQDSYYLWRKQLFETGQPQGCELRLMKTDGAEFWIRLVANLAKNTDGTAVIRAVASDITEPKRVEVELAAANSKIEAASKAKSNFLANMSHELRTPLNTIIGFSEVLQDKMFGPLNEKQETFITNILNSGRHLLSLINDILDISKVEASKMELEMRRINLEELCQGTVAMFGEKARKHHVTLCYAMDPSMDGVSVTADARKIKQILYNLVDNGIKFNRPLGSVSITVQKASDSIKPSAVQIAVEDNGIGIAQEDQLKMFLPFSQVAQSYYDKQTEGTGLGLALTKHLVELHGGTISLRSEIGKGCRFTIILPNRQEIPSEGNAHAKDNSDCGRQ